MSDPRFFPESALVILRQTSWDPDAKFDYEGMSGGLVWSDEFPREVIRACRCEDSWAFRYILAYRASLIRGEPREQFGVVWDQLARECPNWPGLRPERQSPALLEHLNAKEDRFVQELEAFDQSCQQTSQDDQRPEFP
ncbi:hypothetical protein C5Y96_11435 [Blastopirellula marina]|uniref:Uncharacterized protein n=1 Tax=Blastopirellula marina TaxID=124 RepID=A0A2S8FMN9_9BACT|nr:MULTISPECIES: hypothetical protein [Pirellulaceae]PQO33448.1 hypothetical protein C5Y96_11435 [Blastopirellula marina]RCS52538.1 hypothetical protein DTL36_11445 [Bremerella cremea]